MKKPNPSYTRRLWSMIFAFISFALIFWNLDSFIGLSLLFLGGFMYVEHVYQWGFQFWDFQGHEWFGLVFVIISGFIAQPWGLLGIIGMIISTLVAIDFDKEKATNQISDFFKGRK